MRQGIEGPLIAIETLGSRSHVLEQRAEEVGIQMSVMLQSNCLESLDLISDISLDPPLKLINKQLRMKVQIRMHTIISSSQSEFPPHGTLAAIVTAAGPCVKETSRS